MKKLILTTLALCFILPHFAHADITTGMFGYWKLNDGGGMSATDSSGNSNTGTLVNTSDWANTGYLAPPDLKYTNGLTSYVQTTNDQALSSSFTWAEWVRPTAFTGVPSIHISTTQGIQFGTDNLGNILFNDVFGTSYNTGVTLTADAWVHLAVVCIYSGGSTDEVHIYKNGVEIYASTGITGGCGMLTSSDTITLGQDGTNPSLNDGLDGYQQEVRVYNRALTASDILQLYNFTAADTTSNLFGWYKFDEGSGTTAADSSGHSNTGTLGGTTVPTWITQSGNIGPSALKNTVATGGTGGYVTTTNGIAADQESKSYSAWVYPTNLTGQAGLNLIFSFSSSFDDQLVAINSSGHLLFNDRQDVQHIDTNNVIPLNSWTHIAVTCVNTVGTADVVTLYVNGVRVKQDVAAAGALSCYDNVASEKIVVAGNGQSLGNYGFTGYVDDARFYYGRTISERDVTSLAGMDGGLLSWFKFDEGSGSTALDSSPNNDYGTEVGSPTYVTGKIGCYALNYAARSAYVTTATSSSVTQQTMAAWINGSSFAGESGHNIFMATGASNNWFEVTTTGKLLYHDKNNTDHTDTNTTLSTGTWYHVVATDTGSNSVAGLVTIYINGVQDFQTADTGSTRTATNYVSTYPGSLGHFGFIGTVDEPRFYNSALSANQVGTLYGYANACAPVSSSVSRPHLVILGRLRILGRTLKIY